MSRVRNSSMSSYEEERILDEYRKKFEERARGTKPPTHHHPRERSGPISPYLQSVAPKYMSTLAKRPQTSSKHRRKRNTSYSSDNHSKSFDRIVTDEYSSSFESSDSDDSNEKENHPSHTSKQHKSILRNRPSSAPMHRRRHTHDGTTDTDSIKSESKHTIPLFKRQPITIRCMAYKNGSHEDGVTVVAADVKQLLVEATRKLGLNTAGRRAYLETGAEVFRAKDIPFNAKVFISCGEQFKDPKRALKHSGSLIASNSWTSKGVVLEAERKPVRRVMSNRLRRLIGKQSARIVVFLNGDGRDAQEVIYGEQDKFPRLLDLCTSKLKMTSAARVVFGWDGKEVTSLEEVRQLDSCMKNGTTMILGPLWVSTGEGFNPVGALNFVEGIIWGINKRMETAKERSEQLDYACNGEMSKITQPDLVTMTMDDIYTNIEQVSDEIEEMKTAKKKYQERLKILKGMKGKMETGGNSHTMKHIKEIKSDDRIVGQHGLRLKIYENGKDTDWQQIFINMREIIRGSENEQKPQELIRMRFLEHLSHWHKPKDPTGPAKSTLVKRMFNKDGEDILDIRELKNDDEIWLSYGEDFKPAHLMALHIQLVPVMGFLVEGRDKVILRRDEVEITHSMKWETHDGFPEGYNLLRVESVGQKSTEFSPTDTYLQSKDDPGLVVKPVLTGNKKFEQKGYPSTSQSWLVHRNGHITSRHFPQLSLALDADKTISVEMSCGAEVSGYALMLQKKSRGNPAQQWEFSANGQVCSLFNPSTTQVLTMLDSNHFNTIEIKGQKLFIGNMKDGASESVNIVALERVTGSRSKFQRWALKQESIPNQWKHTKVANPSWKKHAYSWPVLPDGNWNLDYKWPMEGTFINSPPNLRGRNKSEPTGTVPLKVLRNGEKNPKRFVSVVVPDLSASTLANDKSVPDAEENVIRLEMNMFLERATSLLNLPFAARRIFNENGGELFSLRKVKREQTVYVTCGEPWHNPAVTKSEAQRRQLLAKLTADVKKIHEYCILREPGEVVVAMENGATAGSRLVVTQKISVDEPKIEVADPKIVEKERELTEKIEIVEDNRTCHQKSHEFSDNWVASRKYPWQQEKSSEPEQPKKTEEKSPRTPRGQRSPRAAWQKDATLLQKFNFKDGFIQPKCDPSLAIGVPGLDLETIGGAVEVQLCKKDIDDLSQRWDVRSDGTIRLLCDNTVGLTVCLPAISDNEEPSPKNYVLMVQKLKSYAAGSSNQRWHLDSESGLLKAFYTSVTDKEVTAANHVSVCTYPIRGPEPLNQDGYIVEMKGTLPSNPVMVCRSCATVMRGGRYPLTHAPLNWSFICAMGDPKKHGLRLQGSFKCLNGKVDLSTYEAEPTLHHWGSQLQRLRQETSVRSINRDLNSAESTQAWRLLVRRNGEGYRAKPEIIVGSSVTGVLDQCSHKLNLSSAARRLYTEDGTQILHMDQLRQWVEKTKIEIQKGSLAQHDEGNTALGKEEESPDVKTDKADGTNSTEGTPDHSTAEYGTQDLTRKPKKKKQATATQATASKPAAGHSKTSEAKPGQSSTHQMDSMDTTVQAAADRLAADTVTAVEIWVSCGGNFINPIIADKMTQDSIVSHTERNAQNLEMDTQLHIARQMHGRRRGHMSPAELIPTKDTKQPVVVTGGWTEQTQEEGRRIQIYNQMKQTQKPKRPRSAARLHRDLYKQPELKRIVVRPVDDLSTSVYAWGSSIDTLLDDAASRLGIRRIARLFYTKDGKKIKKYEEIKRNSELLVNPKRPGSTIRMKTIWARTRKTHGREATEIVLPSPRSEKPYVPPTNKLIVTSETVTSSSSSSSESDEE